MALDSNRVEALELLAPRISDLQNGVLLEPAFSLASNRRRLPELLAEFSLGASLETDGLSPPERAGGIEADVAYGLQTRWWNEL